MYMGGILIKRFDGFRRLCRHVADDFGLPLHMPDSDLLLANRVLAALGGPPAAREVKGRFEGDGLALLLLFLLTQEIPCRVGLTGGTAEQALPRLKGLVHLLGHAVVPTLTGGAPLDFDQVVQELGPAGAALHPCLSYDDDGEPVACRPEGGAGLVRVALEDGPFTLAVLAGPGEPAPGHQPPVVAEGEMHPAVLRLL